MKTELIGKILAVVFLISLVALTIYSRSYAQRQKPFVQLTFLQSADVNWVYETRATIQPISEALAQDGIDWTITITIPRHAFEAYTDAPSSVNAHATTDFRGTPERIQFLNRYILENGDWSYTFSYVSHDRQMRNQQIIAGEYATVVVTPIDGLAFSDTLLPHSAIHQNVMTGEHYIYHVSRRQGAWGREYIATRYYVEIHHSIPRVGNMVNLRFMPSNNYPVVVSSTGQLHDGALVRIFN